MYNNTKELSSSAYLKSMDNLRDSISKMSRLAFGMIDISAGALGVKGNGMSIDDLNRIKEKLAKAQKSLSTLDKKTEKLIISILALRHPMGYDLRLVVSSIRISLFLLGIGKWTEKAVKRFSKIQNSDSFPEDIRMYFFSMLIIAKEVGDFSVKVLKNYSGNESSKAITEVLVSYIKKDEVVDEIYKKIKFDSRKKIEEQCDNLSLFYEIAEVAKNIERVADYSNSIAKTASYIITGKADN